MATSKTPAKKTAPKRSPRKAPTAKVAATATPAPTAEEQQLVALYGDDMTQPLVAHGEFRDARTSDEDRPLTPELSAKAERQKLWDDERAERNGRHRRRRGRDRTSGPDSGHGQSDKRGHAPKSESQPAPGAATRADHRPGPRQSDRHRGRDRQVDARGVATGPDVAATTHRPAPTRHSADRADLVNPSVHPWAASAVTVFAETKQPHPVPTRQLAAMMRKRDLLSGDPDRVAPALKNVLWADERSHRARGLRPPVVYRGRDVFAPGATLLGATAREERDVAAAVGAIERAGRAALQARIGTLATPAFENLCELVALASGFADVNWVKRTTGISYATATRHGAATMLSVRSGTEPLDRRAIGEFRVGMSINNISYGALWGMGEITDDARREMERGGPAVTLLAGRDLVDAVWRSGIVTVTSFAAVTTLDESIFDEWRQIAP